MSVSITITLPEKVEEKIRWISEDLGISRSRYIGNLLLNWYEEQNQFELQNELKNSTYRQNFDGKGDSI
jgi:metal-responsive CopG/Arc/MetJ family transcriptional regulator